MAKPLTPAEEEAIVKTRFLTGAAVPRGEPPFKKLVRRFVELVDKVEDGSSEAADEAFKLFLRETTQIEYQAQKYAAVSTAQKKEQESYVEKQQQLHERIEQAKRDIEAKKLELQQARIERQHMEEYELLRGMISELPARATTQAEIDRNNKQMERIRAEGLKCAALMDRKRKQYALLFHVLDELQRVTDDSVDDAAAAVGNGGAGTPAGQTATPLLTSAMDVDG